ncbi:rod shape-determining protein MreD [Succinimonas amylolytica]|uniref:rod shape-determining protein MreD n=1 Tax=Succinimonas amylolytica TaxID=83769 RepID=UPI0003659CFE|nr:rod shape-determining protein MreD [Succinimonas amylolytica]
MNIRHAGVFVVIWGSLFIGLLLSLVKLPAEADIFSPNYVVCVLLYWVIVVPEKVNVGIGWLTGLFFDFLLGATLGIHAAAFAFMSWIVACQFKNIRYYSLIQKTIVVGAVNCLGQFLLFWVEHIFGVVTVDYQVFWSCLSTVLLWPLVYLVLTLIYEAVSPKSALELYDY